MQPATPLTFYYASGSPFAWTVWLALEHKQVPYEAKLLSFAAGDPKTPDYTAINPRQKVPAIVDGGFALYESGAIVEYLEDKYRGSGAPLWPQDVKARALARRVAVEANAYLQQPLEELFTELMARRDGTPEAAAVDKIKQTLAAELALMERSFAGDYVAGALVSAADFALYPRLAFLVRVDEKRPGHGLRALIPERLRPWMARIEALPYFSKTYPPHWRE